MKAVKKNKCYTISEDQKKFYVSNGYDIYDDEGNLTENGKGKTVSIEDYNKLKEENAQLKQQLSGGTDIDSMTVGKLKEYAAAHNIDLGDATKKDEILELIKNAEGISAE